MDFGTLLKPILAKKVNYCVLVQQQLKNTEKTLKKICIDETFPRLDLGEPAKQMLN